MMLGIAQRLSTRIVSKRRLVARTALLALLAALLSAAPAWADDTTLEQAPGAGVPAESAPEESGAGGSGGAGEEPTGEASGTEAGVPAPQPETVSESPPPAAAEPVSEAPPVEPVSEAPPPVAESPPETAQPVTPERPTSESSGSEAPAHAKGDERSAALPSLLPGTGAPSGSLSSEGASTGTLTGAPTGAMVINLDEAQIAAETAGAPHRAAVVAGGPDGGGAGGCDLPGLGGPRTDGCAPSWISVSGEFVPQGAGLAPVVAAVLGASAQGGGSISDDRSGAAGGGRPMTPSPGPAPGGASGGVAAGGGAGGIGLSGFLAFAALLGLAAPRAMRRLRLACLPWRTAFFVLIPERPG